MRKKIGNFWPLKLWKDKHDKKHPKEFGLTVITMFKQKGVLCDDSYGSPPGIHEVFEDVAQGSRISAQLASSSLGDTIDEVKSAYSGSCKPLSLRVKETKHDDGKATMKVSMQKAPKDVNGDDLNAILAEIWGKDTVPKRKQKGDDTEQDVEPKAKRRKTDVETGKENVQPQAKAKAKAKAVVAEQDKDKDKSKDGG
jgi:hypothetical protein